MKRKNQAGFYRYFEYLNLTSIKNRVCSCLRFRRRLQNDKAVPVSKKHAFR